MDDYVDYASKFIGVKYSWGGNTPEQGFDCSGFACEVLRAYGYVANKMDYTAQGLFDLKNAKLISKGIPLAFYGKSHTKITHVAVVFDAEYIIEAGGEGKAESKLGFVRVRKLDYRSDLIGVLE